MFQDDGIAKFHLRVGQIQDTDGETKRGSDRSWAAKFGFYSFVGEVFNAAFVDI